MNSKSYRWISSISAAVAAASVFVSEYATTTSEMVLLASLTVVFTATGIISYFALHWAESEIGGAYDESSPNQFEAVEFVATLPSVAFSAATQLLTGGGGGRVLLRIDSYGLHAARLNSRPPIYGPEFIKEVLRWQYEAITENTGKDGIYIDTAGRNALRGKTSTFARDSSHRARLAIGKGAPGGFRSMQRYAS